MPSRYLNAMAGRFGEARELSSQSRAILEDLGLTLMLPTLDAWTGQVELLAGDPAAAERLWRRAYQALEGLGEKGNLSTIAAYLAEAVYEQGRFDEAEELTAASESMTFPDDVTSQIAWRTVRAKVAARKGDLESRETLAADAVARAAATDWPHLRGGALEALAEVQLAKGQSGRCGSNGRRGARPVRGEGKRGCCERPTRPLPYLAAAPSSGRPIRCVAGGTTSVIPGLRLAAASSASGDALDVSAP